jgi:hypothetical protein
MSNEHQPGQIMARFTGESVARLRFDPIALARAWEAKQADVARSEAALDACHADLSERFGFDDLNENERAKVPGVERYYELEDLIGDLDDEADALVSLLADAPCQTPSAAAATLGVAAILLGEHACYGAKLLMRIHRDAASWAGAASSSSG